MTSRNAKSLQFDVIVAGSGASAVHAAWPLVQAGFHVAMADPGNEDSEYRPLVPGGDFRTIRQTDSQQHRYFLGDRFEGVPFGPVRVGAQLTPPRQFITHGTARLAPLDAPGFHAMQSHALGGLAAGWGASAMPFSDADLGNWPLGRADLQPHYDAVSRRIGICGSNHDDLMPYVGRIAGLLPPAEPDDNARAILARYKRRRADFLRAGFRIGAPRLAVATREFRGRGPLAYDDMEFWSDHDRSVYRPRYTVEELQRRSNFRYLRGTLVEHFTQIEKGTPCVCVHCKDLRTGRGVELVAHRLILAAGTLGTARIVLESLNHHGESVPFVCNPYNYFPCLSLDRFGKPTRDRRHSLTQLTMIYDSDGTGRHVVQPQLYSYRSLLNFKLVKESPLPARETIRLMRLLQEYFVIVGVFHADSPGPGKSLRLRHDGVLQVRYAVSPAAEGRQTELERRVAGFLRRLGCWPIKTIRPGHGSSIHYAGTFPMTAEEGAPLTARPDGALRAAPLVVLADGSTFPDLPAKGLTFTLMANANRIGEALARDLESVRESTPT
ncbi:GMC family oxidoreductase [Candidatus Poribacteria bacterium]|nr:GMC family oxidoreductase [Candidatus Poribacteria bacterium]